MGAWGFELFEDDFACDVRDEYRELLEQGVAPADASRRMVEQNAASIEDFDDAPIFWMALAATQANLGHLNREVRDRALAVIGGGGDLGRWAERPQDQDGRRAALEKLKATLLAFKL